MKYRKKHMIGKNLVKGVSLGIEMVAFVVDKCRA